MAKKKAESKPALQSSRLLGPALGSFPPDIAKKIGQVNLKGRRRPLTASRVDYEVTTIQVARDTKEKLEAFMAPKETFDSALQRLLNGEADIRVEFLSIDGDTPLKHTALLRLGDDYFYQWSGGRFRQVQPENIKVTVSL